LHNEPKHIDLIIDGCKREERKAQEQLYMYFYDAMMNLCLRYTKCEADAEHVLNAGFLRVFKNIRQFEPAKASIYTWIRTIVTNCCLYHLKTKQKVIAAKELDGVEGLHVQPEVTSKLSDEAILGLVRQLPAATQAVFNLYVIDGYAHKEIATLLQISEGTSKWHLSEARKRLKHQLIQMQYDI
jgi:RNA polymerase sigma factor (sigma-70 family)